MQKLDDRSKAGLLKFILLLEKVKPREGIERPLGKVGSWQLKGWEWGLYGPVWLLCVRHYKSVHKGKGCRRPACGGLSKPFHYHKSLLPSFPNKKASGFSRKISQTMTTQGLYSAELRLSGPWLLLPHPWTPDVLTLGSFQLKVLCSSPSNWGEGRDMRILLRAAFLKDFAIIFQFFSCLNLAILKKPQTSQDYPHGFPIPTIQDLEIWERCLFYQPPLAGAPFVFLSKHSRLLSDLIAISVLMWVKPSLGDKKEKCRSIQLPRLQLGSDFLVVGGG